MDMQTSITTHILTQQNLITIHEAQCFNEEAVALSIDLIDYLYHHSDYDSETVAQSCAQYFGLAYLDSQTLNQAHLDGYSLQFQKSNDWVTALYRPCDFESHYNTSKTYFISAKLFFEYYQKLSKVPDDTILKQTTIAELNALIHYAIRQQASDIHIEPQSQQYQIRIRIDGQLHAYQTRHVKEVQPIIMRLKVLSGVDITQNRLPQDGQMTHQHAHQNYDCRLSFCPTLWGEKVVMRILESNQHMLQMHALGLEIQQKTLLLDLVNKKQGLILVTGPTGSGKTQTLYSILNYLNRIESNIISIEDPIEIKLNGINQIQVDKNIGLCFADILRSILRQDPDIIMIGEIRDTETAKLAIHAALTGHLVLATLHAQDSHDTIARLGNLGVSYPDIRSTLKLVIAQRLIKKPAGGRVGIFELLKMDKQPKQVLSLWDAGMIKVKRQEITLEALTQVIPPPELEVVDD